MFSGFRSGGKFLHEGGGFAGGIGSKSLEQGECLNEVNPAFPKLDAGDHAVFTFERGGKITLGHTRLVPQRADALAKKLGKGTVNGFVHAGKLPAKLLASKLRASMLVLFFTKRYSHHELPPQTRP
jgi:hypothetical protein